MQGLDGRLGALGRSYGVLDQLVEAVLALEEHPSRVCYRVWRYRFGIFICLRRRSCCFKSNCVLRLSGEFNLHLCCCDLALPTRVLESRRTPVAC